MYKYTRLAAVAALTLTGVTGCHDFLTGGEVSNDPNRPTTASRSQIFQGVEAELWTLLGSDPPRVTGIFAQQFSGRISQYQIYNDTYAIDANTTNGVHTGLYGGGGLVDVKRLVASSIAAKDSIFLGIAQVQEGLLMGTGADIFGDLVYKEAINTPPVNNPKLDDQLTVYDSVQKVLSAAIVNLKAKASATNVGPGASDRVYGGDPAAWTALAHTLKARFYMHTAKVRATAYAQALAEAPLGIQSDAGNFIGAFTSAANEQNFYYQLNFVTGRGGYLTPNEQFDKLLENRKDPRRTKYFQINTAADTALQISTARLDPAFQQPFVTADENT
ncbi:MAG TPA: SusD/RagB family nutrient-binding outer membrane lipoprotein, partial [Candidatus Elarobacter sp.]|nr:SusD/RagB family nutrient-binding outer membrane lipoprotein [Candidatus Elarobacter sp.]